MEKGRIRKSIYLLFLVACTAHSQMCPCTYVATFDERKEGKNSAKSGHFWSDEVHA